jgi:hypothetical protein
MDPKSIFHSGMMSCKSCGNDNFEAFHIKKELGLSDNYIFYAICKTCGEKWGFKAKIEQIGRGTGPIHYSEIVKIERIPEGCIPIF